LVHVQAAVCGPQNRQYQTSGTTCRIRVNLSRGRVGHLVMLSKTEINKIRPDRRIQPRRLRLLLLERRHEALHLLLERLVVVLPNLGADVAPGREDVAVLPDLLDRRALAEAGDVGVLAGLLLSAPGVVGPGDALDLLVGQLAVRAAHHDAQLPG